jgi:antitoxin component HigA of HigAB toxin-antitoxin module
MRLKTRQKVTETNTIPTGFLALQEELVLLRPISSKTHYNKALAVAADLASRTHLIREQVDYLKVLTSNIKAYEEERFAGKKHSSLEILKFLVSENGMSGSELGRILGHRTLGPKILNGERQLSKTHIKILARHFSVDPGLFL